MLETGTSGLMSGDEKRDAASAAAPALVLASTHSLDTILAKTVANSYSDFTTVIRLNISQHTKVSPGQMRVGVFQLFILMTVPQLTSHASIAALILLVLLHRSLAPILIFRFVHGCSPSQTMARSTQLGATVVSALLHSESLSLESVVFEWLGFVSCHVNCNPASFRKRV
jgi:hypothetical protein